MAACVGSHRTSVLRLGLKPCLRGRRLPALSYSPGFVVALTALFPPAAPQLPDANPLSNVRLPGLRLGSGQQLDEVRAPPFRPSRAHRGYMYTLHLPLSGPRASSA
jgi:hypothetical protein